ncbi:hypothetical protein BJ508DRAFT_328298 [Ascobolus immersus RN42]|uniref:Clr5 domain-containing protein n=1 Tax=Ascobolus immersus RN42 TaxID=1160509 RepID=A0A3N4I3Z1_ASCIM|nr:hypothetical protein BJ508DRAFT_328298 [Ascobolus immersus RN42]
MPKVLDWDRHRDRLYQRYITEGLPLQDVMAIMEQDFGFKASKRSYEEHFRTWGFPGKQPILHLNTELVERIRYYWSRNYSSVSMLRALHMDGWNTLTAMQLRNLRLRKRILMGRGKAVGSKERVKELAKPIVSASIKDGQTLRYGNTYMSSYMRLKGGIFISEKDLREVLREKSARNQRQREAYLPTGRPEELYNHPPAGVTDFAQTPTPFVLQSLLDEVQSYNLDEYLTQETRALCEAVLSEAGLPLRFTFADDHVRGYLALRKGLQQFSEAGVEIRALEKPLGAMDWINEQKEIQLEEAKFRQQGPDTDFLLYPTDDETEEQCSRYNKGKQFQVAEGNRNLMEEEDEEDDDDGILYLI